MVKVPAAKCVLCTSIASGAVSLKKNLPHRYLIFYQKCKQSSYLYIAVPRELFISSQCSNFFMIDRLEIGIPREVLDFFL